MTVCAVLAAGLSTRFGSPKQLARFAGETLIRRAAQTALDAGCDRTLIIVPADAPAITAEINDLPIEIIENPEASEGVSSSIHLAVLAARGAGILITLCDQPLINSEHLRNLLKANARISATTFDGTYGPPAYFDGERALELLTLRGDQGAKKVLKAYAKELVTVPFQDAAFDIDRRTQMR